MQLSVCLPPLQIFTFDKHAQNLRLVSFSLSLCVWTVCRSAALRDKTSNISYGRRSVKEIDVDFAYPQLSHLDKHY